METYLASAGVSTGSIAVLYILYRVWNSIRGHRLVSDCCGKFYEVGVDVRDMPPTPERTEKNSHQLPSPPEVSSYQSPPLFVSIPKERPEDLETVATGSIHRYPKVGVVESVP